MIKLIYVIIQNHKNKRTKYKGTVCLKKTLQAVLRENLNTKCKQRQMYPQKKTRYKCNNL